MPKADQRKEKQQWVIEKPTFDNARKLKGICFIDPEDGECKETIKNARKKLETLLEAAMPCKMVRRQRFKELREFLASGDTHPHKKTKCACIVELTNPQGSVWNLLFRDIVRITSLNVGLIQ